MISVRLVAGFVAALIWVTACSPSADGSTDRATYCQRLAELSGALDTAEASAVVDAYRELEAVAPEEIRADLVTVREATERLAELEEADAAGIEEVLTPSVQESGVELGRYAEEHCDRAGSPTR